jgi:membrane fusion protein (multidrug efflux system)
VLDGDDGFSDAAATRTAAAREGWLRRWRWPLIVGGPLLLLAIVGVVVVLNSGFETTDNAYVQAEKVPVSASMAGRVIRVFVRENQFVRAGTPLFELDGRDEQADLEEAEAKLASARVQALSLRASYHQQLAAVQAARETVAFTQREAQRQNSLLTAGVSSRQQVSEAAHALDQARRQLSVAEREAEVALADFGGDAGLPIERQPGVLEAQARLTKAKLDAVKNVILAPKDGIVTRVQQLQVGGYINPSQTVFWLISGVPWVEANYKENQLGKMKVGQPATIKIDAYSGETFKGHIASFSPGTGSAFSAQPAQYATGTWVTGDQPLPVQVALVKAPPDIASRIGLSAEVKVDVRRAPGR